MSIGNKFEGKFGITAAKLANGQFASGYTGSYIAIPNSVFNFNYSGLIIITTISRQTQYRILIKQVIGFTTRYLKQSL